MNASSHSLLNRNLVGIADLEHFNQSHNPKNVKVRDSTQKTGDSNEISQVSLRLKGKPEVSMHPNRHQESFKNRTSITSTNYNNFQLDSDSSDEKILISSVEPSTSTKKVLEKTPNATLSSSPKVSRPMNESKSNQFSPGSAVLTGNQPLCEEEIWSKDSGSAYIVQESRDLTSNSAPAKSPLTSFFTNNSLKKRKTESMIQTELTSRSRQTSTYRKAIAGVAESDIL